MSIFFIPAGPGIISVERISVFFILGHPGKLLFLYFYYSSMPNSVHFLLLPVLNNLAVFFIAAGYQPGIAEHYPIINQIYNPTEYCQSYIWGEGGGVGSLSVVYRSISPGKFFDPLPGTLVDTRHSPDYPHTLPTLVYSRPFIFHIRSMVSYPVETLVVNQLSLEYPPKIGYNYFKFKFVSRGDPTISCSILRRVHMFKCLVYYTNGQTRIKQSKYESR